MSAGSIVAAPDGRPVVLGEIGQRVLLVNSRVRVWEVRLAPGESQPWHLHHNPYVVLNLETSPCRMDWLDGSPARFLSEQVGGVVYRPVSPVHMLTNYGEANYRNRIVELLDLGEEASGVPDPVPSPADDEPWPTGLTVTEVFTHDEVVVRGIEVTSGTPVSSPARRCPAVLVGLSHPDEVHYLAPGERHELTADGTYRLVELTYPAGPRR